MSETKESASAELSSSATSQHQPVPAVETLRELPEQNSSTQKCQYRLPLLYLSHVLVQRV